MRSEKEIKTTITVEIESIENGYIVTFDGKKKIHFASPLELARKVMAYFELLNDKRVLGEDVEK